MIRTLVHLQWLTLRGRVVRSLRLLKQPKYLVGAVVGVGWMLLWVGRPLMKSGIDWKDFNIVQAADIATDVMPVVHLVVAFGFTLIFLLPWLYPFGKLGLGFREAELTMLLQAPLSRRQVIGYGLLKSSLGATLTSFFLVLILGSGGPVELLRTFLGLMTLFLFWDFNSKWRSMFLLRQRELASSLAWTRRIVLTIGVLAYLAILGAVFVGFQLSQLGSLSEVSGGDLEQLARQVAAAPVPGLLDALIAPGWYLTAPLFAESWGTFLAALLPLAALAFVQRELVVRSPAHFEESALEHAQEKEAKNSPTKRFKKLSGRARNRTSFALAPTGRPELGVLWKNMMRPTRVPLAHILLGGVAVIGVLAVTPVIFRLPEVPYFVMLIGGGVMMFAPAVVAGMAWSNDLRTEFGYIELLRTWPVSAERFVLAQVASPALSSFMTALLGATLVLGAWFGSRLLELRTGTASNLQIFPESGLGAGPGLALILVLIGVLPLSAGAAFASSAMQNLAVLFVPAWMAETGHEMKGIAAFGRRLVFGIGVFLAFALALIPSAVLVGAAILLQRLVGIPWTAWLFPFWGLLGAVPLFVGGWLIVQVAARLWRDLDPSEEVLEIGT